MSNGRAIEETGDIPQVGKKVPVDRCVGWGRGGWGGGGKRTKREGEKRLCKPNRLAKEKLSAHNTDPAEALGDVKK